MGVMGFCERRNLVQFGAIPCISLCRSLRCFGWEMVFGYSVVVWNWRATAPIAAVVGGVPALQLTHNDAVGQDDANRAETRVFFTDKKRLNLA